MKPDITQWLAHVSGVLRLVVGLLLLAALAVALEPQALAYLAGAFWLLK